MLGSKNRDQINLRRKHTAAMPTPHKNQPPVGRFFDIVYHPDGWWWWW